MSNRLGPPRSHIIESEIGDEISLYDPTTERVVILNTTASDVWRLADGQHTVHDVIKMLARAYQVEPASIRDEVQTTVERLMEEQLLEGGES